jgi:hypothetical protein
MILGILIFLFVTVIYFINSGMQNNKFYIPEDHHSEKVREVNRKVTQIAPYYHRYKGGFSNITRCNTCGRTALREDQHPAECCPECGGNVLDYGAAKWDGTQWNKKQNV